MKLELLLNQIDGLPRRLIYYLEAQGHIRPTRIEKSRIARRDYSEEDLRRIRAIWQYYRRGFTVQSAVQLAERAEHESTVVFLRVPARQWSAALDALRADDRVRVATAVYGESVNLVAVIGSPDDGDVFDTIGRLVRGGLLGGPAAVLHIERRIAGRAGTAPPEGGGMFAYILIKLPAKHLEGVLQQLRDFPGIVEASVVYGETDIIAQVRVASQDELDDLVLHRIQDIPVVESTRTFIGVGGMHWRREPDAFEDRRSDARGAGRDEGTAKYRA